MSKGTRTLLVVIGIVVVLGIFIYSFFAGNYNDMVKAEEQIKAQWGQVENVYQRRFDLIPNLVETVKAAAAHESAVFTQVAEARSRAGGVMNISDEVLSDPEAFARFQQAQNELGNALQRLLAVTESYPQLQANSNFLALQDQLEGTENRISVERQRYNTAVQEYNGLIRRFPQVMIAGMFGFSQKPYFSADSAAREAPQVNFQ